MNWIYYLAAVASGMANPAQAGVNAQLRKSTDHAVFSAMIVYASGFLFMLLVQLAGRRPVPDGAALMNVPWWAWTGGFLSLASTMAGITLAQRLGSGVFTGITVTASLAISVVLDHFGWIGFAQRAASWPRIAGVALMIGGLWLIARF